MLVMWIRVVLVIVAVKCAYTERLYGTLEDFSRDSLQRKQQKSQAQVDPAMGADMSAGDSTVMAAAGHGGIQGSAAQSDKPDAASNALRTKIPPISLSGWTEHRAKMTVFLSVLLPATIVIVLTYFIIANVVCYLSYSEPVRGDQKQIKNYDAAELGNLRVLFQIFARGSQFRRTAVLKSVGYCMLQYVFLTWTWCVIVPEKTDLDDVPITYLSSYLNGFLPFFFALYVNNGFTRWWTMRTTGLGAVIAASEDLSMMMTCYCSGPEFEQHRKTMDRYGVLAHDMIYQCARSTPGQEDLEKLEVDGLLSAPEKVLLLTTPGHKSKLIWQWILDLWLPLYKEKHIESFIMERVHSSVESGRMGAQVIFTHLGCPMPYGWLHLMSFLVALSTIVLGLKSSVTTAKVIGEGHKLFYCNFDENGFICHDEVLDTTVKIASQIVQVCLLPFLYYGFLEFSQEIINPFGTDEHDFPRVDYLEKHRKHLEGIQKIAGKGEVPMIKP